jgi:hypothetical protein
MDVHMLLSRLGYLVAAVVVMVAAPVVHAQGTDGRPLRRVEVGFGGGLLGGAALGAVDANLRANAPQAQDFTLFATDTRFASAMFLEIRGGVDFTRRFGAEGRFLFGRPELRTSVTQDVEAQTPFTAVERLNQYVIEGSVIVMFDELGAGRLVPFAVGGVGYLRQLHEGLTVVEEGRRYHLGGGVKYWFFTRPRGALRAAGVRADARWYLVAGGYELERRTRSHGALVGSVFAAF